MSEKFLLSKVLCNMNLQLPYEIVEEKTIEGLGLIESEYLGCMCTFLDDEKLLGQIPKNVTMLMAKPGVKLINRDIGYIWTENPRSLFFEVHNHMALHEKLYSRQQKLTTVGHGGRISPLAFVSPVGVTIGDRVIIEEFASILSDTVIEDDVIIRSGARIGGQGYEFKRKEATMLSVAHAGGVLLDHDVEIQYNACIDKAVYPWDNTVVGAYTKIDNLVHVAHAAKIGEKVMITSGVVIGGRVTIKDNAWIGIGAVLRNGVTVGRNARANMGAVVTQDIVDNGAVTGNFAIDHAKFIQNLKRDK